MCVEDTDTGEVVGGAQWNFYEKNPFGGLGWGGEEDQDARAVRAQNGGKPKRESMVADWWPEGDGRVFAEDVLEQVYGPRRGKMCRPHACESLCHYLFPPFSFCLILPEAVKVESIRWDEFPILRVTSLRL